VRDGVYVVGVGARPGVPLDELDPVVTAALAAAGVPAAAVVAVATVDRRVPEVRPLAEHRGWRLAVFGAAQLATVPVPEPSETVRRAVGTPSVAQAAALRAAGPGARLVLPRHTGARVSVAVAQSHSCTGTLACMGGR
jgi:cobalamin biosynthesis protein CbiG